MKKKPKKYADGGLAGIAKNAQSLMGDVDSMANTINYGSSAVSGANQPLGFQSITQNQQSIGTRNVTPSSISAIENYRSTVKDPLLPTAIRNLNSQSALQSMKKGGLVTKKKSGMVKSSASKRADGIAMKGKTKGRIV